MDPKSLSKNSSNLNEVTKNYSLNLQSWSGFHKRTIKQRRKMLFCHNNNLDASVLENKDSLTEELADLMIENCVGRISLPYAISPYFMINGKHHIVPLSVEEPSIVAACSNVSKLVASCGGFQADSTENIMVGQITLYDLPNLEQSQNAIRQKKEHLIQTANSFCQSMVNRGGGVVDISAKTIKHSSNTAKDYLVVTIKINVCDCMGANIVNTICEKLGSELKKIPGMERGRIGLCILTNLCLERMSSARFRIPIESLRWKGCSGDIVADRIIEAHQFAKDDFFRAATNNKGVMNGVDAVAIACGQDWRAIESAAHAYAAVKGGGKYGPLADYAVEEKSNTRFLCGELKMPIAVGVVGGPTKTHPGYKFSLELLGKPSSKTLAQVMLAVGLSNNFAALRALAIEGIQHGHMSLHARNIAISAGTPLEKVGQAVDYMRLKQEVSTQSALRYLEMLSNWTESFLEKSSIFVSELSSPTPSLFLLEIGFPAEKFSRVYFFPAIHKCNKSTLKFTPTENNLKSLISGFGLSYELFSSLYKSISSSGNEIVIMALFFNLLFQNICQSLDTIVIKALIDKVMGWFEGDLFRPEYFHIKSINSPINTLIGLFTSMVKQYHSKLDLEQCAASISNPVVEEQKCIFESLEKIYFGDSSTGKEYSKNTDHLRDILRIQCKRFPLEQLANLFFFLRQDKAVEQTSSLVERYVVKLSNWWLVLERDLARFDDVKRKDCIIKDNCYSVWLEDFNVDDSPKTRGLFKEVFQRLVEEEMDEIAKKTLIDKKNIKDLFETSKLRFKENGLVD